ncbi:MAG: hypothetical protein N3F05_03780 [Candidatus Diapherotrites archaeon]|nr:hypothetical protein [Candidatus Diapherotrites archaeon]
MSFALAVVINTLKVNFSKVYGKNYKLYMILPAILFFVLPIIAFIYPGIERGVDLSGGTLIIVRSERQMAYERLESALSKYELAELSIVPFSGGVQIHFGASKKIEAASRYIKDAESTLSSSPQQSYASCQKAFSELSALFKAEAPKDPKECIEEARKTVILSRDSLKDSINKDIKVTLNLNEVEVEKIQYTEISPALGALFWDSAIKAIIIATVLLIVLMFIFFRDFFPVIAILQAGLFDVLFALAALALLRVPFSLVTLSALLMLVGYSIDTDIMLTARVLKGSGKPKDNAASALKTGLTMTGITLITAAIMLVFSSIYAIDIIFGISVVLFFGLLGDLISTWLMNAPAIIWYVEKKVTKQR